MRSSLRSLSHASLVLAFGLMGSLWAIEAEASQAFPSAIEKALNMPCPPLCTTCHATPAGGVGTVTKPFGISAKLAGATLFDVAKLEQALVAMAGKADSDGDGAFDTAELAEGNDPNSKGAARICGPNYGCGAHVSRTPPSHDGTALVFAGSVALLTAFGFRRVSPRRRRQQ